MKLDSNAKGNVAELQIAAAAAKLGVGVYKPLVEHTRADLVFEVGTRLWRVQCKWGRLNPTGDVVVARISSSWLSPSGYVITPYGESDVELFGVYCGDLNRSFLLPIALVAGMHEFRLRLTPPRNSQRACINLAEDFEFDGAVAQLAERSDGIRKARGSNPLSSTPSEGPITIASNPFRNHFGYWLERVAAGEEVIVTHWGRPRIRLSPARAPAVADGRTTAAN